jgi:hypothetical protein
MARFAQGINRRTAGFGCRDRRATETECHRRLARLVRAIVVAAVTDVLTGRAAALNVNADRQQSVLQDSADGRRIISGAQELVGDAKNAERDGRCTKYLHGRYPGCTCEIAIDNDTRK